MALPVALPAHMQIYTYIHIYRQTYIYLFFLLRAYESQKVLKLRVQARAQAGVSAVG